MSYTENFAEGFAPLAAFGAAAATTEQNSGYVNMAKYHRLVIILYVLTTGTTLDLDVEVTTDGVSAGLFNLPGKSITQLTSSDDDVTLCIDIRADELGKPAGAPSENYDWVNIEITPSGAANFTCLVFGAEPRFAPIDQTLWEQAIS